MNAFEEMKATVIAEEKWAHEVIEELEEEVVLEASFQRCIKIQAAEEAKELVNA